MHKFLLTLLILFITLCAKANLVPITHAKTVIRTNLPDSLQSETLSAGDKLIYDEDSIELVPLDIDLIESYKGKKAFNYKEALPEDNWWTRFKQKLTELYDQFIHWILDGKEATGFWSILVELLPYILVAGLVFLVVWIFLKIDSGKLLMEQIKAPETILSDEEELLQHEDLQKLIDNAIAKGEYRIAIRYYYLQILQKLSNNALIDWQVQKTNEEYIAELSNTSVQDPFIKVTGVYENIWYGNFKVDNFAFAKAEQLFKSLNRAL